MITIHKSVTIDAPLEAVWDYLEDVSHLPEIWPSLLEVSDIAPAPVGGFNYKWVYKMAGVKLNGSSEMVEFIKHRRLVSQSKGGIEAQFVWEFKSLDGSTKVDVTVEYKIPVPVLGKLAEPFVKKANKNEADVFLANLKAVMETETITA